MTDAPRIAIRGIDGWDNGWAYANPGDYVVKGEAVFARDQFRAERENPVPAEGRVHDFYPCDPETFEKRWTRP